MLRGGAQSDENQPSPSPQQQQNGTKTLHRIRIRICICKLSPATIDPAANENVPMCCQFTTTPQCKVFRLRFRQANFKNQQQNKSSNHQTMCALSFSNLFRALSKATTAALLAKIKSRCRPCTCCFKFEICQKKSDDSCMLMIMNWLIIAIQPPIITSNK